MKKLIFLLLGIFLISFASANIYILQNVTRPVPNIIPADCNGGDPFTANKTYYFQVFTGGYGYGLEVQGPASEEVTVTTNDTFRCFNLTNKREICDSYPFLANTYGIQMRGAYQSFLDWGGEGYMPWAFNNNETGVGHGSYGYGFWSSQYGNPGQYRIPELKCGNTADSILFVEDTLNVTGSASSSRYLSHPEIAVYKSERDILNQTFDVSKGKFQILYDGTNDWDDLVLALREQADPDTYKLSKDSLTFMGDIISNDSGATLEISGKSVTIISGTTRATGYTVDGLTFNEGSQVLYDGWGSYRGNLGGSWENAKLMCTDSSSNDLDSFGTVYNLNIYANSMTHYQSWDGFTFSGPGDVQSHQSRYFSRNQTGTNGVYYNVYEYHTPTGNVAYLNTTFYHENLTFHNDASFDDRWGDVYCYFGYVDDCLNNTWNIADMYNVFTDRADPRPIHEYQNRAMNFMCGYTHNYTYHSDSIFTVTYPNGTKMVGAIVNLTSNYNSYQGTTNSNGEAKFDLQNYLIFYNNSNCGEPDGVFPGPCADWLNQGEYALKITMSGYGDYEAEVEIIGPEDWTISLAEASDTTSPTITVTNPTSGENIETQEVLFEFTTDEDTNCTYKVDSGNAVYLTNNSQSYSFTLSYPDIKTGNSYSVLLTCADSSNNEGTSTITFSVQDSGITNVQVTSPTKQSIVTTQEEPSQEQTGFDRFVRNEFVRNYWWVGLLVLFIVIMVILFLNIDFSRNNK